jgi:hypothetical protein
LREQAPVTDREWQDFCIFVDGTLVCSMKATSEADAKDGYLDSVAYYRPDVTLDPTRVEARKPKLVEVKS